MKSKLCGSPTNIKITYPIWRDERRYFMSVGDIAGTFSRWAVDQSPYDAPDNLTIAIKKFSDEIRRLGNFSSIGFIEVNCEEVRELIQQAIKNVPEILSWNIKKNPSKNPHQFSNIYGRNPDPDDDFIDLGALCRNTAHTLILQCKYDCASDNYSNTDKIIDNTISKMKSIIDTLCSCLGINRSSK